MRDYKPVTFLLDRTIINALRRESFNSEKSQSQIIRDALTKHLKIKKEHYENEQKENTL